MVAIIIIDRIIQNMLTKDIYSRLKGIVIILISVISAIGCTNTGVLNNTNEYLSIACTTYLQPNTEEMMTSIYQYTPETEKLTEVFSFPYTSQYPLGVLSNYDRAIYYTKSDNNNRDQIYSYNLDTKDEVQLTTELRAINQIIPTEDKIFFVASSDKVLRLGVLDKKNNIISYWGDEDTNVETIAINPNTQKIYISAFSYKQDRENIQNQFISDDNKYSMPLFSIYETNYSFTESKELFADHVWIRSLVVNMADNNLLAIYDKEYNSDDASKGIYINTNSYITEEFVLPPERIQVDGCSFSADGKGLYVMSVVNGERGIYYYDFKSKMYASIFISKDGFINNFQMNNK